MSTTEERLAVLETQQETVIDLAKEIRTDVKGIAKTNVEQDKKIASLEQSRATARKAAGILGVPIIGTVLHTVFKTIGLY